MVKQLILGDARHELANTRRILESLPNEHMTWKPHLKSMTLGSLTTHLVNLLNWQIAIFLSPELDLSTVPMKREPLATCEEALEEFDVNAAKLEKLLDECGEDELAAEWTLRNSDHVIFSQPRALAFRTFGLSHMIHHRAQLGVYLRLLDIPLPGMYGPTADEKGI
ncbi:damage-inducible protein DinB [Paenibacillus yonginensis]|uniref:Damage-inducible protein DinB n=1 Tax=Paenibacillus yonginensis TaxID=1462996 RepID=A0A1B1N1M9_9BACL|nr:DinB family protein [Paenibacillus yonginensis]ANS75323.1 damage-inducible protein DinB [Paenibacillus yonginensis]